jgi:hypothetical protein
MKYNPLFMIMCLAWLMSVHEAHSFTIYSYYRLKCVEGKNVLSKGKQEFDFFNSSEIIPTWDCYSFLKGDTVFKGNVYEVFWNRSYDGGCSRKPNQ